MLSEQQKNELYRLIVVFIGDDPSISGSKLGFNGATVDVVERMIAANIECNQSVKELVSDLVSGGRTLSRGWLKQVLGGAQVVIDSAELRGYGCRVFSKARWKTEILYSTY